MRTLKQNLLEGWLQEVYESADSLLDGLHSGRVHFTSDEAFNRLMTALVQADLQIAAYVQQCAADYSEPDHKPESDPGPSQEQRS